MTHAQLRALAQTIENDGPDRVVIDASGEAVPPARARADYGVIPMVIFIREDTWCLGAPQEFAQVAWEMWQHEWIAKMQLGNDEWRLFDRDGNEIP